MNRGPPGISTPQPATRLTHLPRSSAGRSSTSSNTVVVAVSGSAYAQKAGTLLTVKLTIHDTTETIQVYANQASTHMALPTGFFARDGEYGQFDVTLSAGDGNTFTDQNDHFQVALIY
jgi:hypothetical protein